VAVAWGAGCGGQKVDVIAAPPSCDVVASPCGGDVVGTWNVVDCPLELTGEVDLRGFGLGCTGATITSGQLEVAGTWVADASGRLQDDTTTRGEQRFEVSEDCQSVAIAPPPTCDRVGRVVGDTLGYEALECADNPETRGCTCSGRFDQRGGLGAISSEPQPMGTYSATGTTLATSTTGASTETQYEHCVRDDVLVLTLPSPNKVGLVVGSIVLQRR
jgi:hypothetical protein